MSRRKGTPCACNSDPCSCGSSKGKCIRAINNVSPDPNGDFNIKAGAGIAIVQSNDDEITVINTSDPDAFLAGDNIEIIDNGDGTRDIRLTDEPVIDGLTVNGDTQLNGDLEVNGDIIQNGAAYETHAEQVYSRDDYIIMRDGAIAALAPGDYSGFQVKLYDGVNDGRLVIDNTGTARVGDVGSEQPLLTRDEAADLTDGDALVWDAANLKAVSAARSSFTIPLSNTVFQAGSTADVTIVDKVCTISIWGAMVTTAAPTNTTINNTDLPKIYGGLHIKETVNASGTPYGQLIIDGNSGDHANLRVVVQNTGAMYCSISYTTE